MEPSYFLKIEGIEGESKKIGHVKEIEMDDWSFGETQTGTSAFGSGSGAGRVSMQDFRFHKRFDKASPKLFQHCCLGKHIERAVFTARRAGTTDGKMVDYMTVVFYDLIISSYDVSGSGEFPSDSISFNFAKVSMQYKQLKDGKVADTRNGGYDLKTNRAWAERTA